jgi:hypothetical protein
MKSDLLIQPDATFRLGDFLTSGLKNDVWSHFFAAAAFVKRSGTKHIRNDLSTFVARGGKAVITAGIDAGGTSFEGLTDLLVAVGEVGRICAFKNANSSTFHPKVFMFSNHAAAELVVGSGNLTEGGLFTNYEAGLRVCLDLSNAEHAALYNDMVAAMEVWSTPTDGLCYDMNPELLSRLHEEGLVPNEAATWKEGGYGNAGSKASGEQSLFARHAVQAAPKVAASPTDTADEGSDDDAGDPDLVIETPTPVAPQPGENTVYLMTLQRTDVGVGQTTEGASRRSPEIFIPLVARDTDPEFWGWPSEFVADPQWTGPVDKNGRGKMDRPGVMIRLGGAIFPVHFWYNPDKRDFRMRSENMRSAGVIDDILYVERSNGTGGFNYYVDVVPQGSPKHVDYLARCTTTVRNSKKRFGYL